MLSHAQTQSSPGSLSWLQNNGECENTEPVYWFKKQKKQKKKRPNWIKTESAGKRFLGIKAAYSQLHPTGVVSGMMTLESLYCSSDWNTAPNSLVGTAALTLVGTKMCNLNNDTQPCQRPHDQRCRVPLNGACLDRRRYPEKQHTFSKTWHGIRGYLICLMHARFSHLLAFKERSRVTGLKVQAAHNCAGYSQFSLRRRNPQMIRTLEVCGSKCA